MEYLFFLNKILFSRIEKYSSCDISLKIITHRPIAKLITGHSIALQREEIYYHTSEHWHKLP